MDRAELLRWASHYRDLATRMLDEQTSKGLIELAERYEALAERRTGDRPDGPPPD